MPESLLTTLIDHYDLSDLINHGLIFFLLLLLMARLPLRLRLRRKPGYY